ncbi:CAP domain-containing protein [Strongyloides ratti]|uniref:CAP domain-containing protein n=1 Tax=Strongyloides ratti TaxID=34506 RepID=A0A090L199_STRRB|nr:CAP domain-containing protein [Strongyloides ratti]CEF63565.1 CAP domain-containing protein [Strongyloides ratti]
MKFLLFVSIFIPLVISSILSKKKEVLKFEDDTTLYYYTANLKRVYACKGYLFYNETKAILFQDKIFDNYKKIKSKSTPDGGYKNKFQKLKYKYLIGEKRAGNFYEINPFVERFRQKAWPKCYECFKKLGESDFRCFMLKELNYYRKLHGIAKVSYHSKYNTYAKGEAKKFLKTNKYSSCVNQTKFKCVYLPIPAGFAHTVISTLYEKLLAFYNWEKNVYKSKLDTAIHLIWKKLRYIGVGFAQKDGYLNIFLTFSSKVKNDKDYKKNIRPILKKYIKLYGKLPRKNKFAYNYDDSLAE